MPYVKLDADPRRMDVFNDVGKKFRLSATYILYTTSGSMMLHIIEDMYSKIKRKVQTT